MTSKQASAEEAAALQSKVTQVRWTDVRCTDVSEELLACIFGTSSIWFNMLTVNFRMDHLIVCLQRAVCRHHRPTPGINNQNCTHSSSRPHSRRYSCRGLYQSRLSDTF
jgi:hypothetical protein